MVRRIGEMLRLQDQRPAVNVHVAGFADDRAVEEIARVELNARLRRAEVERAASRRLDDACRVGQASRPIPAIEHLVVIVAAAEANLLVRCADPGAHRDRHAEVERRTGDRRQLARRNERRIDRRE